MISEAKIQSFRASLHCQSFCPGEEGYNIYRMIHNAGIDRRPAIIVRCSEAADVIACVHFARDQELLVSVRGGGHSIAGKSVCDNGIMIDLSAMKRIHVQPDRKTVRAEPGLTLGEFDQQTQAFGLATTMGVVSKTGIAGLTLGGGIGHLVRKHGLACDNLISADIVTADGKLLPASTKQNQDLFWGLRGGGGNFGVVTSFEYRLHAVGPVVFAGGVLYPVEKTAEVLRFYREFTNSAPDEISLQALTLTIPELGRVAAIGGCYCGPPEEGEKALQALRAFGSPVADLFAPMPYVQLQSMFDPLFPPGRHYYTKANFLTDLTDEAIRVFAEYSTAPSTYTAAAIEHLQGAVARVESNDTAFPHRKFPYNFSIWSGWSDPAETEQNIQWTRDFFEAMKPSMAPAVYVNYLEEEGDPTGREAYGQNYQRLAALKKKYDPTNFFRMNHNIRPG